ncbi:hypothetical protein [Streptomyces rubiginosohelvolus]|uniref:hypothetical protein n=1 Tax=Streptomyces rubiginosohelvolus TaxID=67362 RepID=UPI00369CB7A1
MNMILGAHCWTAPSATATALGDGRIDNSHKTEATARTRRSSPIPNPAVVDLACLPARAYDQTTDRAYTGADY